MKDGSGGFRVTPPPRPIGGREEVDIVRLWKTIDKIASVVNQSARHTETIPDIHKKVDATGIKVVDMNAEMKGLGRRVNRIESKVDKPHDCYQIDALSEMKDRLRASSQRIDSGVVASVETKERLEAARSEISDLNGDIQVIRAAPKRLFYGLAGIFVTLLLTGGSAVWFLAELNKDVQFERTQRVEQFERIEKQNRAVPGLIRGEIAGLEKTVSATRVSVDDFNNLCRGMTRHQRKFVQGAFRKQGESPLRAVWTDSSIQHHSGL